MSIFTTYIHTCMYVCVQYPDVIPLNYTCTPSRLQRKPYNLPIQHIDQIDGGVDGTLCWMVSIQTARRNRMHRHHLSVRPTCLVGGPNVLNNSAIEQWVVLIIVTL